MSTGPNSRAAPTLRQAPGTVSIADALARAKRDDFKPGTRDVTTADRIYKAQTAAVVTSSAAPSGAAEGRMRWIVLGVIAAVCVAIAIVAALFTILSAGKHSPSTKGGTRVTDVAGVLYLQTEAGQIINAGPDDFAADGSNYEIHYHENGRFTFSANGYAQPGYFLIDKGVICRSRSQDTVGEHCTAIFRMDDGSYQARAEKGGKLRYIFRVS